MKFEEALHRFIIAMHEEYGVSEGITKLGLEPDLFDRVVMDLHGDGMNSFGRFKLSSLGDMRVMNVQIMARKRETF